jgi:hypothetical protein
LFLLVPKIKKNTNKPIQARWKVGREKPIEAMWKAETQK